MTLIVMRDLFCEVSEETIASTTLFLNSVSGRHSAISFLVALYDAYPFWMPLLRMNVKNDMGARCSQRLVVCNAGSW